jgi:NADPH-dependent glutamate synthase beta subunit-like oxidoreductase
MYAKMALIMFYPFHELSDLTCIGESYWKTFQQELTSHHKKEVTKFWKKGFKILQNIQDRLTLQKILKRPRDSIFMTTVNEKPNKEKKTKSQSPDVNNVMDILQVGSKFK